MTTIKQPGKLLSKNDFKFLMRLLDNAEDEASTEIEMGSEKKRAASIRRRQIMRIRLALIDLNKQSKNDSEH